jgi:hypothetical protein
MAAGLRAAGRSVPPWLSILEAEATAEMPATACFSMHCFWQGESELGALDGVLGTRTGFVGGAEAVEVTYDPSSLSAAALAARASTLPCRPGPVDGALRPTTADDKHHTRGTVWASVPMTPAQATRVNAALGAGRDPAEFLSPRQRTLATNLARIPADARPVLIGRGDLAAAWAEAARATR